MSDLKKKCIIYSMFRFTRQNAIDNESYKTAIKQKIMAFGERNMIKLVFQTQV